MATKKTNATKKTAKATTPKAKATTPKAKAATPKATKAKKADVTKVEAPQPKAKKAKATPEKAEKKMSQIQAAIKVLGEAKEPMNTKAMVEAMEAKGLWSSPSGKTPAQTLYASILRDIAKGKDARFAVADRGTFTLASKK